MEPKNIRKNLIKGEIADYIFEDRKLLISYSKQIQRTVKNITENVNLVKSITQNTPVPLLIFLKPSPMPDKQTRELSKQKLPEIYTAMAMVAEGNLGSLIMNILFKLQKPPIPMKTFSKEEKARIWLKQFM
ncbi:MAG: hypothetical protein RJA76_686 [Bacteroidota bacterium]|jgi:hypothetical protein